MGQEAFCWVTINGKALEAKVLLETDEIVLRGGIGRKIPFTEIKVAQARDGRLILITNDGEAVLELGTLAEKWAEKIRNPRTLMDKLGVKAGSRVRIYGVQEPCFLDQLTARGASILADGEPGYADNIFLQADEPDELDQIGKLRATMQPNGAIWVITPRGRPKIADVVVMKAGKSAGLVDTKVCRFSDTHTALKFVIPVKDRS